MNNTEQFFARLARWSRRSNRFLTVTALVVVLSTAYVLMKPAITAEGSLQCGLEPHTHSEQCWETTIEYQPVLECGAAHTHSPSCYDENGALVCGYPDVWLHVHDESCYDEDGALVCPLPEITEHTHTEACYDADGNPVCDLPWHVHDESCFVQKEVEVRTLVCELPEHTHTPDCFDIKPTSLDSDEKYVHYHTEECYRDGTLICTLTETVEEPEPVVCERNGSEQEPNRIEDYGDGVTVGIPEEAKALLKTGKVFENTDTFEFTLTLDNKYPFVGQSWLEYPLPCIILSSSGETVSVNTEPQKLIAGTTEIGEWFIRDNVILFRFDENSGSISPVHLELPISVSDPAADSGEDQEIEEAPVEETGNIPAEEVPEGDTPAEETPAEEIPAEEIPTEETEKAPEEESEETPTEEDIEKPAEEDEEKTSEEDEEKTSEEDEEKTSEEDEEDEKEASEEDEEASPEDDFVVDPDADFMFAAKRLKVAAAPLKLLAGPKVHDGTSENPHTIEDYNGAIVAMLLDGVEDRLLSGDPFDGQPSFTFRLQIDNEGTYMYDSWFEYEIPFDWENHPKAYLSCATDDYRIHSEGDVIGEWELTRTSIRCHFNKNAQSYNNVHMLFTLMINSGEDYGQEFDMKRPFVIVQKLDAYTRAPLPGITFGLFDQEGTELAREVTDEEGKAVFYMTVNDDYLNFYEPYYIKEMYDGIPPEYLASYAKDNRERWFVSVSDVIPIVWESIYSEILEAHPDIVKITQSDRINYINGTQSFEILNYPYYSLPATGGNGELLCFACGISLLAAAAVVWKFKKRSRNHS